VGSHVRWGEDRAVVIPTPLEGAGFTVVADPRWYTIVRMLRFTFETNAEVANRVLTYELERKGKVVWASHIEPTVVANTTQTYNLIAGGTPSPGASDANSTIAVLPEVLMHPGDRMIFGWTGIKGTDKATGIVSMQERFDFAGIPNTNYTYALRELAEHLHKEMTSAR
jgi:hypothetical protein